MCGASHWEFSPPLWLENLRLDVDDLHFEDVLR